MSGCFVLFHRDGSPADRSSAEAMLGALGHCGPDGSRMLIAGSAAIGHQHLWTTPEEVGEQQPLGSNDDRYLLVLDGRLDNRSELLDALGDDLPQQSSNHVSDAALVLAAFQRWGEHCFERLLGPFAVVIADQLEESLLCARDPLGDRTLCYHLSPHLAVIASEEAAVLAHPDLDRRLDEQSLAAYYAVRPPAPGATMFRQVEELLPGHCLSIDRSSHRSWRYWTPPLGRSLRYRRDEEYREHFLELLDRAVTARLRTISAPAVLMSGGLDSTSVATLAARSLAARAGGPLTAISWVFDELAGIDERRYIDMVASSCGLRSLQLVCDDAWPLCDAAIPANPSRPELSPYRLLAERAFSAAREAGATVLLSGWFDHIYSGGGSWLVELARDHRLGLAAGELARLVLRHGRRSYRHPFLRAAVRQLLGRLAPRSQPTWLTPTALSLVRELADWPPWASRSARPQQQRSVLGLLPSLTAAAERYHGQRAGIEQRYPYRDRRLVELMLSLPAYQLYRHATCKYILVEAMRGILPEPVRTRTEMTSLTPLYIRGIHERQRDRVQSLLQRPDALWRRYVRAEWLQREVEQRRADSLVLWLCLSMEAWLEGVHDRQQKRQRY